MTAKRFSVRLAGENEASNKEQVLQKHIGILTSGGDCPGLNAAIRGIGKAALMPIHRWLPAAMVAPTPVSALLHAVAVLMGERFSGPVATSPTRCRSAARSRT